MIINHKKETNSILERGGGRDGRGEREVGRKGEGGGEREGERGREREGGRKEGRGKGESGREGEREGGRKGGKGGGREGREEYALIKETARITNLFCLFLNVHKFWSPLINLLMRMKKIVYLIISCLPSLSPSSLLDYNKLLLLSPVMVWTGLSSMPLDCKILQEKL